MTTPQPFSKAEMDPNFEKRLRELAQHAQQEQQKRQQGQETRWCRPENWNGDLFDVEGMSEPFRRDQANADYVAAVKDPQNPGVVGDVVATTTMIEELAVMERAFRLRYMRRPRAVAQLIARKRGQGSELGPLINNGIEYVRGILKQAKTQ